MDTLKLKIQKLQQLVDSVEPESKKKVLARIRKLKAKRDQELVKEVD